MERGKPVLPGTMASNPVRQAGVYTLMISLVLVGASMLAIRGLTKSSLLETRITSNEQVTLEVSHAADAMLNYGLAWYTENEPVWTTAGGVSTGAPAGAIPAVAASNGDTYNGVVTYTRASSAYVLVTATATATGNSAITATVRQYIHSNLLIGDPNFSPAPLTLDGCTWGNTGSPDLYPGPENIAIQTSTPADCLDQGHIGYNGGTEGYDTVFKDGDIWNYFFTISRAEMKAIADQEVADGVDAADRSVVWVTSTSNYHTSWGSPTNPVILVFAPSADCPKVNGNPTIYGVVFVDSPCDGTNGWGGTEVFGSVAINGSMKKLNANTEITHWGNVSNTDISNLKLDWVARIPGSWRDF